MRKIDLDQLVRKRFITTTKEIKIRPNLLIILGIIVEKTIDQIEIEVMKEIDPMRETLKMIITEVDIIEVKVEKDNTLEIGISLEIEIIETDKDTQVEIDLDLAMIDRDIPVGIGKDIPVGIDLGIVT
jgi:hypothetical protein